MAPSEFWRSNPWDVMDAYDGWALANGVKTEDESKLTAGEVRELKRMMEKHG